MTGEEWLAWLIASSLQEEMYVGNGFGLVSAITRNQLPGTKCRTDQVEAEICLESEFDTLDAGVEYIVTVTRK